MSVISPRRAVASGEEQRKGETGTVAKKMANFKQKFRWGILCASVSNEVVGWATEASDIHLFSDNKQMFDFNTA